MLQKSSTRQTLDVFFRNPTTEFTLKNVSRFSKLAHTSTKQNLNTLIRLGFVQQRNERKGKRTFPLYKAGRNTQFIPQKKLQNLAAIIDSGIIEYIEERLMPKCIVLFGSYQHGEDTEESDTDLFIEAKKTDVNLKAFEKKLDRKIELHFNERFMTYPSELKNNIINGVVLHGFLEGYP